MNGLFITGNHTNIGKTTITAQIIKYLLLKQKIIKVRKPVETACVKKNNVLLPQDAIYLSACLKNNEPLSVVCPYRFEALASSEYASQINQTDLTLNNLIDACYHQINPDDFVIIEGAGGLCSPIAQNALNIDLAVQLNLPIVLVIKDELGAVNQALLAIKVAQTYRLNIAIVVLNQFNDTTQHLDNHLAIEKYSKIQTCIFNPQDDFMQTLSQYLTI